jgi:hypothetical protein
MPAGNGRRRGDSKRAAHIETALTRSQASLALGGAQTHERCRRKRELNGRATPAQRCDRFCGKNARLIEAAARILRSMERHGNHQHLAWQLESELQQSIRKHPPKPARDGT